MPFWSTAEGFLLTRSWSVFCQVPDRDPRVLDKWMLQICFVMTLHEDIICSDRSSSTHVPTFTVKYNGNLNISLRFVQCALTSQKTAAAMALTEKRKHTISLWGGKTYFCIDGHPLVCFCVVQKLHFLISVRTFVLSSCTVCVWGWQVEKNKYCTLNQWVYLLIVCGTTEVLVISKLIINNNHAWGQSVLLQGGLVGANM